jgi:elongation factor P
MATTSDISKGAFFRYENELLKVLDYDHITPGKGNAIYSVKCRNVETGKQSEIRFRSGEKIDFIRVDEVEMQYIYSEGDFLVCMNQESMVLKIRFDDQEKPLNGELPKYVELDVTYAEDGNKSKLLKSVEVEGGISLQVPLFVSTGDRLRISTETGEYVERVK